MKYAVCYETTWGHTSYSGVSELFDSANEAYAYVEKCEKNNPSDSYLVKRIN